MVPVILKRAGSGHEIMPVIIKKRGPDNGQEIMPVILRKVCCVSWTG
jgi:hypothetical protein